MNLDMVEVPGPQTQPPTAVPAVGGVQAAKVVDVAVAAVQGLSTTVPVKAPRFWLVTVTWPLASVLTEATYLLLADVLSQPQAPAAGNAEAV